MLQARQDSMKASWVGDLDVKQPWRRIEVYKNSSDERFRGLLSHLVTERRSSSTRYRDRNKGMQILSSNSKAGQGRTVKQEQEEISRNHVQTFSGPCPTAE